MLFELLIATYATEVSLKCKTTAFRALVRSANYMLIVAVFAYARSMPRVDVEAFSARHPPLAKLLGSSRYELKLLTTASCTG